MVEKIQWDDRYAIGIERIDAQHRKIIGLINRLVDLSGVTTDSTLIEDTLNEMTIYATEHLDDEERLLERCGYPHLDEHAAAHKEFRKCTALLCYSVVEGRVVVPEEILTFLCHWWSAHILHDDMAYRDHVTTGCGVAAEGLASDGSGSPRR